MESWSLNGGGAVRYGVFRENGKKKKNWKCSVP